MARADTSYTKPELTEDWIVRVLQGIEVSEIVRHVVVRLDDRRVCLTVVAPAGSEAAWTRYSKAAANRAGGTGDRLCPLLASGRTDDCYYVAYDVGESRPLSAQDKLGTISGTECAQVLHGVGRGLEQAAAAGIHPTELTPDSVFMDPQRGAVLADLGITREALGNPTKFGDRDAPWVAPEVLEGENASERSAVYSFGAFLYTLLTGAAPDDGSSLRELRPDLPEALEVVLATALARDPKLRYRTVSETRNLANILLQGGTMPGSKSEQRPREATTPPEPKQKRRTPQAVALKRNNAEAVGAAPPAKAAKAAKAKAAPRGAKAKPARPGRGNGRPATARARAKRRTAPRLAPGGVLLAMGLGVLILGALAGVLLAGPGAEEPPPPRDFEGSGLQVRLPGNWTGTVPAAGALEAHPEADPGSGLVLEQVDAPVEREEQGNPVRLGRLEAWREPGADVAGALEAVRYVIPTESGKLVATCRASLQAEPGTLADCERVASTLQLRAATGLPVAEVIAQQQQVQAEIARLGTERAAARRRLAAAELPAGQRVGAEALERVHDRAATRFEGLPGGEAVAAAARRTAVAYRALANAANGESAQRFNAARARVRRSEASLRAALADQ